MITPRERAEEIGAPMLPMELFELIHDISVFLILDDRHDIGRFQYWDRSDHFYHGRRSRHHPSPWHHWQVGIFGLLFSQLGAVAAKSLEMLEGFRRMESGDMSGIDKEIVAMADEENTIPLEEYRKEVVALAPSAPAKRRTHVPNSLPEVPVPTGLPGY